MNSQLNTILRRSGRRLYSSSSRAPSSASSSSGSKLLPTVLAIGGGGAAGLGAYYYYDPNADVFQQARKLIGVDNQGEAKAGAVKRGDVKRQEVVKKVVAPVVAVPAPSPPTSTSTTALPLLRKADETKVAAPPAASSTPSSSSPAPVAAPVLDSTAAAAIPAPKPVAAPSQASAACGGGVGSGDGGSSGDAVPKSIMVTALRAQQEALLESHEAKLKAVRVEYERKLGNAERVSEADRVVELRGKYEKASAALNAIEKGIEARSDQNARAKRLRALWAQVNALHARVNHPEYHGSTVTSIDKKSLQRAVEVPDKFVNQMLDSLPNSPVHSLESLKQRFYEHVEPTAKNVSLMREGEGFSMLKYACGKVLSWGVVDVKRDTLKEPEKDVKSTSQVLDYARGSLEKGDLLSAAIAVNKLSGLPKQVAQDWLADARALLETNQTLFVLMTYAASNNVF